MSELDKINKITEAIIGAAIEVHRTLGPGLLESAYEACLSFELIQRGFQIERQKTLGILYKGVSIDAGYRMDLLVNEQVIIEIKAVEKPAPIHTAQLLFYLRLSECKVGLLINFNVELLKHGIKRLAN
ncbi:MAG: GxxExxY protein [Anaerolineae bacterium]|nr:GxxExxY protein [Anaerolineae bacterium]